MSVTPGFLIHDIDARKSSRVLARPGGESNMDGILGDPALRINQTRGPVQSSGNAPVAAAAPTTAAPAAASTAAPNSFLSTQAAAAEIKRSQQNSSIFDFSHLENKPRSQKPAATVAATAPVPAASAPAKAQPAPTAAPASAAEPVRTNVRTRVPPGGHSSIIFG